MRSIAEGLFQFGHRKDDPTRPQIKVMLGVFDPLGMPLATDVWSGERADDGLYLPIIEQMSERVAQNRPAVCRRFSDMSALETRAYLAEHQDMYFVAIALNRSHS